MNLMRMACASSAVLLVFGVASAAPKKPSDIFIDVKVRRASATQYAEAHVMDDAAAGAVGRVFMGAKNRFWNPVDGVLRRSDAATATANDVREYTVSLDVPGEVWWSVDADGVANTWCEWWDDRQATGTTWQVAGKAFAEMSGDASLRVDAIVGANNPPFTDPIVLPTGRVEQRDEDFVRDHIVPKKTVQVECQGFIETTAESSRQKWQTRTYALGMIHRLKLAAWVKEKGAGGKKAKLKRLFILRLDGLALEPLPPEDDGSGDPEDGGKDSKNKNKKDKKAHEKSGIGAPDDSPVAPELPAGDS